MRRGLILHGISVAGALLLLQGCAQAPAKGAVSSGKPHPRTPASDRSSNRPAGTPEISEAELERRAQAHAAFAAGLVAQDNDAPENAYEFFEKSVDHDPSNEPLVLDVARHLLDRKQPERAAALLKRAAAQPGASGAVRSLLGVSYARLGRTTEAMAAYREALRVAPDLLPTTQALMDLLLTGKRANEALKVLDDAARQGAGNAVYQVDLADLFAQLGRREPKLKDAARIRTLAALSKAAAAAPDDPGLLQRMGERFESVGETAKAEELFKTLRERFPRNPVPTAKLAELYLRNGRTQEAREQLEALRRDNPANPLPFYYLGLIALEDKEYPRAVEQFERALLLDPGFEPVYADLAAAQLSTEQPAEALATLEKAKSRFVPDFRRLYIAALAHGRLKRPDEALADFQAAEKADEGKTPSLVDHRFFFQVGAMLEQAGRFEAADTYLQKALAIQPDFDEALNHLGYSWADRGIHLDQALDMIERAVKAEPENPAYLDSLGWIRFKTGRFADAVEALEKAVKLLPQPDATVLDHLADVLSALGRKDEAKELWRRSIAIEASDAVKRKLEAAP